MDSRDESYGQENVSDTCEAQWHHLQELHASIVPGNAPPPDQPLAHIYAHKERLLKAHLQLLQERPVRIDPASSKLTVVKEKLRAQVSELEETLEHVRNRHEALNEECSKAQTLHEEQTQVKSVLETRVREEEQRGGSASEAAVEAQLTAQHAKYNAHYRSVLQAFLPFVRKHFPQPESGEDVTSTTLNQSKKRRSGTTSATNQSKLDGSMREGGKRFQTLSSMLEQIMNKSVDSPADPYLTLDPALHYQPYVELLLRSGVIVRHGQNQDLVKITPFHL